MSAQIPELQQLNKAKKDSHKGQNGKLLLIGGSALFHAASLWSLTVASRIVDLVHYASVTENNDIVQKLKEEFRNGIVIPRSDIPLYIEEDDVILIGPGMDRSEETKSITNSLVITYPHKQWVIDAGALQMIDIANIPPHAILTPHHQEFALLTKQLNSEFTPQQLAEKLQCILVLKGQTDIVTDGIHVREIVGGNEGMTKGGTGDVLAGLIAALSTTSSPFVAACVGSYINKAAGDELYKSVGPYFNASDLANEIPHTMKKYLYP